MRGVSDEIGSIDSSRGLFIGVDWRFPYQEDDGSWPDLTDYSTYHCYDMEWSSEKHGWVVSGWGMPPGLLIDTGF